MAKVDDYRDILRFHDEWDEYLLAESGLPGPRGNLELARAVAYEGNLATFRRYAAYDAESAPVNSPYEFLAFCGVLGLGRLIAEGDMDLIPELRSHASDSRWRTREAVAMAMQWWGDADMPAVLAEMKSWADGNLLEQRAAVAGLCEPRLLTIPEYVAGTIGVLDRVTAGVEQELDRRSDAFRALRQSLGYCWSVAVAADPDIGKPAMARWLTASDPDVRWIMRENLKKKRLERADAAWVQHAQALLAKTA
jgi:hypothetical protein